MLQNLSNSSVLCVNKTLHGGQQSNVSSLESTPMKSLLVCENVFSFVFVKFYGHTITHHSLFSFYMTMGLVPLCVFVCAQIQYAFQKLIPLNSLTSSVHVLQVPCWIEDARWLLFVRILMVIPDLLHWMQCTAMRLQEVVEYTQLNFHPAVSNKYNNNITVMRLSHYFHKIKIAKNLWKWHFAH